MGERPMSKREDRWVDAEHGDLLGDELKAKRQSYHAQLAEAATYLQMNFDLPATVAQDSSAKILDTEGMRELGWSLVHELIRTARSQIVRELQVVITPIGGDWERRRACEAVGPVVDGTLRLHKMTQLVGMAVVDGACCPLGGHLLTEIDAVTKNLVISRLEPTEVFWSVERDEATFTRYMPRRKARARYGRGDAELIGHIDRQDRAHPPHITGVDAINQFESDDLIEIREGYALAIGPEPGRHVVQLGDGTILVDDVLTRKQLPKIPVDTFVWTFGHRGQSDGKPMVRSIAGQHSWLQEMIWKLYDSLEFSVPWVTGPEGTKMPSNVPGQLVTVPDGADPGAKVSVTVPSTVSQDVRTHITDIVAAASRAVGISEQAAEGAPPASIKTGVGISKWKAVVNESLSDQHQGHDALWAGVATSCVLLGPTAWGTTEAIEQADNSDLIEQIDFKKLDLTEGSFSLGVEVVSGLGQHIPQKVEMLELALGKGAIDLGQYFYNLDLPEFKHAAKRFSAERNFIEYQISQALNHGKVVPPSDMQTDLEGLVKSAGQAWLNAETQRVKPKRNHRDALRVLWRLARDKAGKAGSAAAPQLPGAAGLTPSPAATVGAGAAMAAAQPSADPLAEPAAAALPATTSPV